VKPLPSISPSPASIPWNLLDAHLPDTASALGTAACPAAPRSGLRQRQTARRAEILRQTRILLGQEGYEAFSIRRVAHNCDMAPQTVYNLVGDRDELLGAAICQHVRAMIDVAQAHAGPAGFFMSLADLLWRHGIKHGAYSQAVLRALFSFPSEPADTVRLMTCGLLRNVLDQQAAEGRLRERVDTTLLAHSMQALIVHTGLSWAPGGGEETALRRQLVSGIGFLLLGALRTSARTPVEDWMDQVLSPAQPAAAPGPRIV